jgi:arylamine N-acetyltransferase
MTGDELMGRYLRRLGVKSDPTPSWRTLSTLVSAHLQTVPLQRPDRPLYEMTLEAQPLSAFVPMYRYHQTSAESIFAKGLICTRATLRGRITLSRDRLSSVEQGSRSETVRSDRDAVLEQYFGIASEAVTC